MATIIKLQSRFIFLAALALILAVVFTAMSVSSAGADTTIPINAARGLSDGTVVTIQGTVTVATKIFDSSGREVYIQDSTGGIQVYYPGNTLTLVEGDVLKVTGKLSTFAAHREIVPTSATKVNTQPGTPVTPILIHSADGLNYSGELAKIEAVIVAGSQDYFTVTDSSNINQGNINVYIYDNTGIAFNAIASRQKVCVTGIVDPYNTNLEILPRSPKDIVSGPCK